MKGETTASASRVAPRGLSPIGALVRRHDPDRYQTALFAPAERREPLFILYAFNYEIARVRESVTTPMLGQIRLQWWREVIDAAYAGAAARRHQIAEPLTAMIREYGLTRIHFDRLIDARERDLDGPPPLTLAALEDYAEASSAGLLRLALEILGVCTAVTEAAAREIGIAYALAGLLRAMGFHARAGKSYIPQQVAADAGLDPADYAGLRDTPPLRRAAAAIAAAAAAHLDQARRQRSGAPRAALPALLPAIVAQRVLKRLRQGGGNPFDPRLAAPDPLLAWRLAAAMLRGRF